MAPNSSLSSATTSSGECCSAKLVNPFTSENSTVTIRRSPPSRAISGLLISSLTMVLVT